MCLLFFSSSQYFLSRDIIPFYLNSLNLSGVWAEVGVQKGYFSHHILQGSNLKKLYSIDPWKKFDANYVDIADTSNFRHYMNFILTKLLLFTFWGRSQIVRATSTVAASDIQEELDFVYLDWRHHYEAVKEDISIWYPKITSWGVLSGHDYMDGINSEGSIFWVKSAVDEFVLENKLELIITKEANYPSWIIRKP